MLQLLQRGDRSAQEPATRMGHILFFPCLFWEYIFWQLGRDNIGCMLLFLAWCRRTLNFLIVCAVSESWSWWSSFFASAPAQSISPRTATTFVYVVLYFHFLYISHINQLHLHDIHLLPVMYISYIIYIILNSRCYTGVRAPKLSHRSSYIKEPFGKGLDGLPGGWMGASEGLEGGLRGLRPVQGGFKVASRGLEKGFKGAWEGLQAGLKVARLKGASRGLEKSFKGASRGLEKGLKGASRGLEKGFKGASRGLEKGFKGAWEGLQGGFKPFSPSCPPPGRDPSSPPWRVPSKVVARIQPPLSGRLLGRFWVVTCVFCLLRSVRQAVKGSTGGHESVDLQQVFLSWSCQRWQTAGGGSNPCWSTRESQVRPAERQRAPTTKKDLQQVFLLGHSSDLLYFCPTGLKALHKWRSTRAPQGGLRLFSPVSPVPWRVLGGWFRNWGRFVLGTP